MKWAGIAAWARDQREEHKEFEWAETPEIVEGPEFMSAEWVEDLERREIELAEEFGDVGEAGIAREGEEMLNQLSLMEIEMPELVGMEEMQVAGDIANVIARKARTS